MFVVALFILPSAEFYFFSSDRLNCAASIVRVGYYTNQIVLNTLWNSYLNQATKNVYRYLYFPNFSIPKEIRWWKSSKQKRNLFIISVTSTLPSQSIFGPSCFTKFTLVLKINVQHCQLVQFCLLLCGDTACKNGALGGWSVWFK